MWWDNGEISDFCCNSGANFRLVRQTNAIFLETQRVSNLYVATHPDVCQQIGRKRKGFRWAECYMMIWRDLVPPSAAKDQTQSCNIWTAMEIKSEGEWGWRGVGGVGGVFSNVWGERASLQQKADARRFALHCIIGWPRYHLHTTWGALYADRSNRTMEGGSEGEDQRWPDSRWKKGSD